MPKIEELAYAFANEKVIHRDLISDVEELEKWLTIRDLYAEIASNLHDWTSVDSETLPDDNILVEVKNENWLIPIKIARLQKRMWVHPDLNCFLSPVPTHWRHIFL